MGKKKIFVALSGGVDSAVAAFLLKKDPKFSPRAVYCHFYKESEEYLYPKERAQRVAGALDIPFYALDLTKEFRKKIVTHYIKTYQKGLTPNPCVVCNKRMKFGLLLRKIKKLGAKKLATGHYVVKKNNYLYRGKDRKKDQSYFLWSLNRSQIKDLVFPVGRLKKEKVKKKAERLNLPVEKSESNGVCFFQKGHAQFIKKHAPHLAKKGEVVDKKGKTVGTHKGTAFYTIGQRYGFDVDFKKLDFKKADPPPLYVTKLIPGKNQIMVGFDKDLYRKNFKAGQLNFIGSKPAKKGKKFEADVQIRHLQKPKKAKVFLKRPEESKGKERKEGGKRKTKGRTKDTSRFEKFKKSKGNRKLDNSEELNNLEASIEIKEKIRSIAPGQSAVFYNNGLLLGGGVIKRFEN